MASAFILGSYSYVGINFSIVTKSSVTNCKSFTQ